MKETEIISKAISNFRNRESFTRSELREFFLQFEHGLLEGTFAWRIWKMKNKGSLHAIDRGVYAINKKSVFKPLEEVPYKELHNKIMMRLTILSTEQLKKDVYCIWDTKWLNRYMVHQLFSTYIVLEVNENYIESVFFSLKEEGVENIFYKPGKEIFSKYMFNLKDAIVLKSMYTRSPVQSVNQIRYASIEKILVDLCADADYFYFVQGREMNRIYENAFEMHNINLSKLLNYALRRHCKESVLEFIPKEYLQGMRERSL